MRLLLDEHISPRVATALRSSGHDVVAALEVGLRQLPDDEVLRWAVSQRRAVVTLNVQDFRPLHARLLSRGEPHFGLVFLPRSALLARGAIGRLTIELGRLLERSPGDEALASQEHWLEDASD